MNASVSCPGSLGMSQAGWKELTARLGRRVKLVTENYVWQSGAGIVSAGVRFFGERMSADVALGVPVGGDAGGFAFPVVNFVYLF